MSGDDSSELPLLNVAAVPAPEAAPEIPGLVPPAPPAAVEAAPAVTGLKATGDGALKQMMDGNFLQYAAYVIRDRAIPDVDDGLKPVQRRILFSLHENDDGKFIKVANIVGYCMQFHPHGDASIGDALVTLANKQYLIERQGNFGNIFTGDPAAAVRYIECRLTPLAREVMFNDALTKVVPSYDGRKEEPVTLPAKIPLLLMLGADGIAVGIATRILPHNFAELLEAQIAILQKKGFSVLPDFPQGGLMDARAYDEGRGHVLLRAHIEQKDAQTLVLRALPFGVTTDSVMASIEEAARKGQIKLKSLNDYTAEQVEIEIQLPPEQDPARAMEALFAFTQCQVQVASRIVVIRDQKPVELTVPEILRHNTDRLLALLRAELMHERRELVDALHNLTLVRLFIEQRLYKRLETCDTAEAVHQAVLDGLVPFRDQLQRDASKGDIEMLLGIPIRRISLFDLEKNRLDLERSRAKLAEVETDLGALAPYAIRYLRGLLKKYGADYPRRTQLAQFGEISERELTADALAINYDRAKGYLGYKIPGEPQLTCSPLDKLLLIWRDGRCKVVAPADKLFVDSTLLYCAILDRERVLTVVFELDFFTYIRRCVVGGLITNREYRFAPKGSQIRFFADDKTEVMFIRYTDPGKPPIHQQIFALEAVPIRERDARAPVLTSRRIAYIGSTKPADWNDELNGPPARLMPFA
jgi:topoisomerase-4 subunit A